jgi:hypothetical protein
VIYNKFLERGDFQNIVEVWFLICILENKGVLSFGDFGGQACPRILVISYFL